MIRQRICKEQNKGKSGFRNSAAEESVVLSFLVSWLEHSELSDNFSALPEHAEHLIRN